MCAIGKRNYIGDFSPWTDGRGRRRRRRIEGTFIQVFPFLRRPLLGGTAKQSPEQKRERRVIYSVSNKEKKKKCEKRGKDFFKKILTRRKMLKQEFARKLSQQKIVFPFQDLRAHSSIPFSTPLLFPLTIFLAFRDVCDGHRREGVSCVETGRK